MIDPVLRSFDQQKPKSGSINMGMFFILIAVVVIAGTVAGFFASGIMRKGSPLVQTGPAGTKVNTAKSAGVMDKKTFKDSAEGTLREGGIDGEGSFHLERPGGKSQNVYLTSTTVDLSKYIGKRVRVSGETFNAQTAGWLMDVGLVEVL